MVTHRIARLRNAHRGETAYVVGRGPSLLALRSLPPGPVIVLNAAIREVRALALPNPIYSMQKDGCGGHCRALCETGPRMTLPQQPETLLVHVRESVRCFADYRPRYVFDNPRDFGLPWFHPSSPTALAVAHLMGAERVVFVAHDAAVTGDERVVTDGALSPGQPAYRKHRPLVEALAAHLGVPIEWSILTTAAR